MVNEAIEGFQKLITCLQLRVFPQFADITAYDDDAVTVLEQKFLDVDLHEGFLLLLSVEEPAEGRGLVLVRVVLFRLDDFCDHAFLFFE